ncbi:MAG: carbamoylphosphate synthase large subunit [Oscillospiraceae bacterium]|nr:carbamoylphosphate synthase large subunit [Oscillospiraceae bacterium]MBQ2633663.1 carbamoylphosphate synthase large subunit [Oscillospiraceae bacterium]MBR6096564.1 carbamoylphosphate synthase large subunit [Oscillospiraceae bacterium]
MRNFIFISPNFPTNYWRFCRELAGNGLRVLGIGDQPYDELLPELRESLSEYYRVSTLENYDEVYRAVGFFIGKYGRIDWLESNNEYWLERDAMLRTDYNIRSGFQTADMARVKFKSGMKEYYQRAGIPTARWHIVEDRAGALAFAAEAGFPLIVKPDNGVGASQTYKLNNPDELEDFLRRRDPSVRFIMEEFVAAEVNSYDAIYDSQGEPLFETGNVTPESIMDTVNNADNSIYYIVKDLAEDVRAAGRAAAKSFGVRSRFIHFEFFRLTEDQRLGKRGDVVALEVNMRPCGGFSPDMMNYAHSTDVYKIWADMIAFDRSDKAQGEHGYCAFAGRRDGKAFSLSDGALVTRYARALRMTGRIPDALADAMGNRFFIAVFPTKEEMEAFYADALRVIPAE